MITVDDLTDYVTKEGMFLYCEECGARYSATKGDYWFQGDDPFMCAGPSEGELHELTPMVIAREICRVEVAHR